MASLYGPQLAEQLVREKGWAYAPQDPSAEPVYGDPQLLDPVTGKVVSPHEAQQLQQQRDQAGQGVA